MTQRGHRSAGNGGATWDESAGTRRGGLQCGGNRRKGEFTIDCFVGSSLRCGLVPGARGRWTAARSEMAVGVESLRSTAHVTCAVEEGVGWSMWTQDNPGYHRTDARVASRPRPLHQLAGDGIEPSCCFGGGRIVVVRVALAASSAWATGAWYRERRALHSASTRADQIAREPCFPTPTRRCALSAGVHCTCRRCAPRCTQIRRSSWLPPLVVV